MMKKSPKPKPTVTAKTNPKDKKNLPKIGPKPSLNDFLKEGKRIPKKLKPGLKPYPDGKDVVLSKKTR